MSTEIDGVNGIIKNTTSDGDITIKGNDGGSEISALTFDMSDAGAATFNGTAIMDGNSWHKTNKIAYFGDGLNLQISSDGTNAKIAESGGSGNLVLSGQTIRLAKSDGEIMIEATNDAGVDIRHNHITKLETTANGVTVTDGILVSGSTPTLTIGDGGAEDAKIIFDGNAQNFYIGLDDSTDKLTIGLGNALGTTPGFTMDENTNVVFPDNQVTIQTTGTGDHLTLVSTDGGTGVGPNIVYYRNSSSPAANDYIGEVTFRGRNAASQDVDYARINARIKDVGDGAENANVIFNVITAGAEVEVLRYGEGVTILNEGSADQDLRIESNDLSHMLYIDAGRNEMVIGNNVDYSARFAVDEQRTDHRVANFEGNSSSYAETAVNFAVPKNATDFNFFKCEARGFANKLIVRGDGNVTNANNSYGSTSDEKLKSNIVDANSQWDDIKSLKVRNFKLKTDPNQNTNIGVIAQELETAGMNGLVTETEADEYQIVAIDDESILKAGDNVKEVKYSVLYMKAIKALQEAQTRIETLETKVAALEG